MLKPELTIGEVPGTMYGLSDSGWVDSEIFESWFTNNFLVYAPPARPLLLLMDGHSSHFSPLFVNKTAEEQVIVFCLPPHSTHKTQLLDKGVFSPLKRAWREECHSYILANPGKVVTCTPLNTVAGFKVTGVYGPTDRYRILPKSPPKPQTICERTGLKFIPLFTPVLQLIQSSKYTLSHKESVSESEDLSLNQPFTDEEEVLFARRKEEGYDLTTDERYNLWLSLQVCEKNEEPQPSSCTAVAKVLATIPPITKNPSFMPKSTARVITSEMCRYEINEKARKKAEALRLKEERKALREQKQQESKRSYKRNQMLQERRKVLA